MIIPAGSMKVFKYPLTFDSVSVVSMIVDAKVIHVASQNGVVTLWAIVPNSAFVEPRRFRILGTGHELPLEIALEHVGSCLDGSFVWHVFEELNLRTGVTQ
jgi:hypothetical protein